MNSSLRAGLAYFAIVFAAGVVLGTLRALVLVPRLGATAGLMVELPLMLVASWFACRWSIGRFDVSERVIPRFVMGGVAFGLLMIGELVLSLALFGRSPAQHVETYETGRTILGLIAQLAFAAFPLVQRWLPPGGRELMEAQED